MYKVLRGLAAIMVTTVASNAFAGTAMGPVNKINLDGGAVQVSLMGSDGQPLSALPGINCTTANANMATTDPLYNSVVATLLSAKVSGKQVDIYYGGTCGSNGMPTLVAVTLR